MPLVQLLERARARPADLVAAGDPRGYADLVTPAGLAGIAGYADAIGPEKGQVIARDPDGSLTEPTALVAEAHAAGLRVHAYTFRNENHFLPANLRSGAGRRRLRRQLRRVRRVLRRRRGRAVHRQHRHRVRGPRLRTRRHRGLSGGVAST